jgi:CheY-like chemotaxis protein
MDVFLAGQDGLGLLGSLKDDPQVTDIPVVMTSGMEMSEACSQLGAAEFLLKPYEPETLVEVLRRLTTKAQEKPEND